MAVGLTHYLIVAAILFTLGVAGIILNRKNIIVILMSVELMLLAVNLNLVAFSAFLGDLTGQVFALLVLTVAAAESAIGLAILVVFYRNQRHHRGRRHQHDEGLSNPDVRPHRLPAAARRRRSRACSAARSATATPNTSPRRCSASPARWPGSPSSASASATTTRIVPVANWFTVGDLEVNWAFRIDTLTAVMLIVVTTVSTIVHVYSFGYMHDDPHRPRFFSYLSLFTFAMLMLVTSDNLVQMFFGWEGVGLASYLLIGFWYERPTRQCRRHQGLRGEPRRRLRLLARHLPGLRADRIGGVRDDLRRGAGPRRQDLSCLRPGRRRS